MTKDKMLFFSIPYTEGWSATVNGETVEVEKANVGFMAIPITEGENHVVLKYRTPWLTSGHTHFGCNICYLYYCCNCSESQTQA